MTNRSWSVAMFTFYCDDSGTHPESDVAVAGAYIATAEQWAELKRNWDETNRRERFGVFHMADFVARQQQFALPEWKDEGKRERTIGALIGAIKTRVRYGIAGVVEKSAYDELVPADLRKRLGKNHYTFALRQCIAALEKWRRSYGHTDPIQYVFDRLPKGQGRTAEINSVFQIMESGGEDAMARYGLEAGGWSFQDKTDVVQLQAADIWAYENLRYVRDWYLPESEERPRRSYLALRKAPGVVRYHNRRTLTELVQAIRESDTHECVRSI
jgi:Protein of unknown function (DUF3800)